MGSNSNHKRRDVVRWLLDAEFVFIGGQRHERWRSPDNVEHLALPRGSGDLTPRAVLNVRKAIKAYTQRNTGQPTHPKAAASPGITMSSDPTVEFACVTSVTSTDATLWQGIIRMCDEDGLWTVNETEARELAIIKWGHLNDSGAKRRFTNVHRHSDGTVWWPKRDGHVITHVQVAGPGMGDDPTATPIAEPQPPLPPDTQVEAQPVHGGVDPPGWQIQVATILGLSATATGDGILEKVKALRAREKNIIRTLGAAGVPNNDPGPGGGVIPIWERVADLLAERDRLVKQMAKVAQPTTTAPLTVAPHLLGAVSTIMDQLNAPVVLAMRGGTRVGEQDAIQLALEIGLRALKVIP